MRSLRITISAIAMALTMTGGAYAGEYCHPEWSPERGNHVVCSPYPDPRYDRACHWEWSPSRGNYRVCE
jgi:hypothetical protein